MPYKHHLSWSAKRLLLSLSLLLFVTLPAISQEAWTNKSRVLPDKLREVSTVIMLHHSPNPNYPEVNDEGGDSPYVWKHSTTVCSPDQDLEVIEAGSFIWYSPSGWQENVQYSKRDFAKRFDCPKGLLKAGECYTFEKNYRYGGQLYGGDALWFVLAKDSNGQIVKGMAIIETEARLKDE